MSTACRGGTATGEETIPAAREAESRLQKTGAEPRHGGDKAYRSLARDYVQLPSFAAFLEPLGYYATAMPHTVRGTGWTGISGRGASTAVMRWRS